MNPKTIALASASFAALGAGASLPGALLPELVSRFALSPLSAGTMLAMTEIGYLVSVLAAPNVLARHGTTATARESLLLFTCGSGGLALGLGPISVGLSLLAMGLGFGALDVATNALLVSRGGSRTTNILNLVHFFFGLGALSMPAATSALVNGGLSWRITGFALAGVALATALGWHRLPEPEVNEAIADPRPVTPARRPGGFFFASPRIGLLALILGLYVGVEVGAGSWIAEYMVTSHGTDVVTAGTILTGYWAGLALGRLLLSRIGHRFEPSRLLFVLSTLSLLTLGTALLAPGAASPATAFFATGLALAGIFPAVIELAGRDQPGQVARATSAVIATSAVGGIVFPWLMSLLAQGVGIGIGMRFYIALCAGMAFLSAFTMRRAGQAPG